MLVQTEPMTTGLRLPKAGGQRNWSESRLKARFWQGPNEAPMVDLQAIMICALEWHLLGTRQRLE